MDIILQTRIISYTTREKTSNHQNQNLKWWRERERMSPLIIKIDNADHHFLELDKRNGRGENTKLGFA